MTGPKRWTCATEDRAVTEVLTSAFGDGRVQRAVTLAPLTTFKTGGTADWFLETDAAQDVVRALATCSRLGLPVTVIGGGSNILVGDRGVRGLVLRMRHGEITPVGPSVVRADAGVSLNGLVRWTVNRGLAGLEQWAGTPGTVGGALHGNAHFQGALIGNQVVSVDLVDRTGIRRPAGGDEISCDDEASWLQKNDEVVLAAEFAVSDAAPATLREVARASLAYRKKTQPLAARSAGCIFRNLEPGVDTLPSDTAASAGALIDRAGLKGRSVGHAQVSGLHGNFIVSGGGARSNEIRELVEICRGVVRERFGIRLFEEIVYLGDF